MLKQLGRLERTRNIVILGFAVLMAVSLIVFYAPGRTASRIDPSRNTEVVAKVGSATSLSLMSRGSETTTRRCSAAASTWPTRRQQAFPRWLDQQACDCSGGRATGLGRERCRTRRKIRKQFTDASGTVCRLIDTKNRSRRVTAISRSLKTNAREIAQEKLRAFVSASVNVSDAEVEEEYKRRNSSFDVSYVPCQPTSWPRRFTRATKSCAAYYDSHKTDYRYLEPQKKVRYIFVDTEKVGSKLQIPDADLKAEYEVSIRSSKRPASRCSRSF